MGATHLTRKLGQGHVYHCAALPTLLITAYKLGGTEEQFFDLWERNVLMFLFLCDTLSQLLNSPGSSVLHFMHQVFSVSESSGLLAG